MADFLGYDMHLGFYCEGNENSLENSKERHDMIRLGDFRRITLCSKKCLEVLAL